MISGDALPQPPHNALYSLCARGGNRLRLWFIHFFPQIQGDSLLYADIARNWLTHGIYGRSLASLHNHRPNPRSPARIPRFPGSLLCGFRQTKLPRGPLPASRDRSGHMPPDRGLRAPRLRPTIRPGRALAGRTLSLHRQLRGHASHRDAFHLLRRAWPLCLCRGARASAIGLDAGSRICLELCRALASRWRPAGGGLLSRTDLLWANLARLCSGAPYRIVLRPDGRTAVRRMDPAELAHVPRLPAPGPPIRHGPR